MLKSGEKGRRLEDRVGEIKTTVAPNTRIKGAIKGPESVHISGRFEGEIHSGQMVWLGSEGIIQGNITSPYVIIEGRISGNINSAEHVELRSTAHMVGNIRTEKIAVADGSFFEGQIKMPSAKDKPIDFVEKRQAKTAG